MVLLKNSYLCVSTINLDEINLKTIPIRQCVKDGKLSQSVVGSSVFLRIVEKSRYRLGRRQPTIFHIDPEKDAQKTEETAVWGLKRMIGKGTIVSD